MDRDSDYVNSSPIISNPVEVDSVIGRRGSVVEIELGQRLAEMSPAELDLYFCRLIELVCCEGREH